ncbi:hypothetical protein ACO0LG_28780 [Undibacterium sp. Ji42W]|uniref:hypothetical protein n=1 Tax=Undibacterium sp. Ji42W TaxID=3413039 RepID=UPI003BF072FF
MSQLASFICLAGDYAGRTPSKKPYWRSGFYHIATTANVPLGCVYFDFAKREVSLVDYLAVTGDRARDMACITALYQGARLPSCAG